MEIKDLFEKYLCGLHWCDKVISELTKDSSKTAIENNLKQKEFYKGAIEGMKETLKIIRDKQREYILKLEEFSEEYTTKLENFSDVAGDIIRKLENKPKESEEK